jgi:molecular chaperone DnaK
MAAFRTSQGVNEAIVVEIGEEHRSIIEICSAVMSHVRGVAEKYLGTPIRQAVFTVPVGFGPGQREALKRAAKLARFEVIELLEEPVAGALTYGIGLKKNEIVAVYDFGGGTFDFSLLDFVHDQFRVLGTQGDPWLGGDDFDSTLAQHVADEFWRGHQIELRQRVVEWQRLLIACERVKRKLSSAPEAELYVEAMVDSPRIDIRRTVRRDEFDRLCKELVGRSLSVCNEALAALKLEPSDATELVLTGGVSSIPMVREAVSQLFQREIKQTVNPEQAVALGAGLRAAQCVNHPVLGVAAAPE